MFIALTITHTIVVQPDRSGMKVHQSKVIPEKLYLFPVERIMIMQAGADGFAEVAFPENMGLSWKCAEMYGDVMARLEAQNMLLRIPRTNAIIEGMAEPARPQPFPMKRLAGDYLSAGAATPEVSEAIAEAMEAIDGALREEGYVNDAAPTWGDVMPKDVRIVQEGRGYEVQSLTSDCQGENLQWERLGSMHADNPSHLFVSREAAEHALELKGMGNRLQADERNEPEAPSYCEGDLAIMRAETGFCVQRYQGGEGGWSSGGLPGELTRVFSEFAAAAQAVRIAGYARRLVDVPPLL